MDYHGKVYEFHKESKSELVKFLKAIEEQTTETNAKTSFLVERYLPKVMTNLVVFLKFCCLTYIEIFL